MDLPNAIYDGEETFSTGAHIGFGKMVTVVDRLLRSRAGMSSAESANPWVDLMATIVSPSTEEAAVIARAHVAFPWVRIHAIRMTVKMRRMRTAPGCVIWSHGLPGLRRSTLVQQPGACLGTRKNWPWRPHRGRGPRRRKTKRRLEQQHQQNHPHR